MRMSPTLRFILILLAGIAALLAVVADVFGERAGDTVELTATYRDSDGVSATPDSARLIVLRDHVPIDSSQTIAGLRITTYDRLLIARYTIPASAPDSSRFSFWIRAFGTGVSDDYIPCVPATVLVHEGTIDSIAPTAVADLFTAYVDTLSASLDSTLVRTYAGGCCGGIYESGLRVTGAYVLVTRDSTMIRSSLLGSTISHDGNYEVGFPLAPGKPDTVWISALHGRTWLRRYLRVIVP